MKSITAISLALTSITSALTIPSGIYKYDELAEAKEEAAKDDEALVFVFTDPKLKPS